VSLPRVLHVITSTGVGGAEGALARLVRGLAGRYHFEVLSVKAVGETGENLRADGFLVDDLGAPDPGPVRALSALVRETGRRRPDLVHAWLFRANFLVRFAARLRGVPNIASVRTLEMERTWQPRLDALTHGLVDRYLAVSRAAARFTAAHGVPGDKITVVPNGLAPGEFEEPPGWREFRRRFGVPEDAFLAVCAGRLRWEKGQAVLLEALARLAAEGGRPAFLLLAGAGPDEARLREQARALGLEESVRFGGLLEDPREAYRAADLLVQPSLWEGMPNAVLEAMAQGTPAVASSVGGVPEVVRDAVTGLLVPPGDPAALATAVARLRDDEALRASMGRAALARAREAFPLQATLEATAAVYEELLARRSG